MSIPYDDQPTAQTAEPDPHSTPDPQHPTPIAPRKPLRLWPGVVAAVLLVLGRFVVPSVIPEAILYGLMAGLLGILAIVVWWIFFSRAPWFERLGAVVLMAVALFATSRIIHI